MTTTAEAADHLAVRGWGYGSTISYSFDPAFTLTAPARAALASWDAVAGFTFVEVPSGGLIQFRFGDAASVGACYLETLEGVFRALCPAGSQVHAALSLLMSSLARRTFVKDHYDV